MKLTKQEQRIQTTTCWMLNAMWAVIIVIGVYHKDLKKENKQFNTAKNETIFSK